MIATVVMLVLAIMLIAIGLLGAIESRDDPRARWRYWLAAGVGLTLLLVTLWL